MLKKLQEVEQRPGWTGVSPLPEVGSARENA
jgi:hypothetical protein